MNTAFVKLTDVPPDALLFLGVDRYPCSPGLCFFPKRLQSPPDLWLQERPEYVVHVICTRFYPQGRQCFLHNTVDIEGIASWVNDIPGRVCVKMEKVAAFEAIAILEGFPNEVVSFSFDSLLSKVQNVSPEAIWPDKQALKVTASRLAGLDRKEVCQCWIPPETLIAKLLFTHLHELFDPATGLLTKSGKGPEGNFRKKISEDPISVNGSAW
jgi:hypothetical protein